MPKMSFAGEAPKLTLDQPVEISKRNVVGAVVKGAKKGSIPPEEEYRVDVIVSTGRVDRDGDTIEVEGLDLSAYKANPVVLFQHNTNEIVARAENIRVEKGKLLATAVFAPEGQLITADRVRRLVQLEMLNTVSIGFIPTEYTFTDPDHPWDGIKFLKGEMIEFSFVTIPANTDARIIGRALSDGKAFDKLVKAIEHRPAGEAPAAPTEAPAPTPPPETPAEAPSAAEVLAASALEDAPVAGAAKEGGEEGEAEEGTGPAEGAGENPPCNRPSEPDDAVQARLRAVTVLRLRQSC